MSLNWLSASRARQTICRGVLRGQRWQGAGRGAFALLLVSALTLVSMLALAVALLTPHTSHAHGGLSLGLRIQQEFYKPLVPVARNFKTCFKTDTATGVQVMSFCTEAPNATSDSAPTPPAFRSPERIPAGAQNVRPIVRPALRQPLIHKVRKK